MNTQGLQLNVFNFSSWKSKFDPGHDWIFQVCFFNCSSWIHLTVWIIISEFFTDKVGENRSKQCCIARCQNEAGMHSVTYLQRRYEITPEWLINHGWSMCVTVIWSVFRKLMIDTADHEYVISKRSKSPCATENLCQKHLSTCIMGNLITSRSQVMVCCFTNNRTFANSTPEWLFCLQKLLKNNSSPFRIQMSIFHKPIHDEICEAMVTKLIYKMTGWSIAVSWATCLL